MADSKINTKILTPLNPRGSIYIVYKMCLSNLGRLLNYLVINLNYHQLTPVRLFLVEGDFCAENHKIVFVCAKMLDNLEAARISKKNIS